MLGLASLARVLAGVGVAVNHRRSESSQHWNHRRRHRNPQAGFGDC